MFLLPNQLFEIKPDESVEVHPFIADWNTAGSNLCLEYTPAGVLVELGPKRDLDTARRSGAYTFVVRAECLFDVLVFVKRMSRPDADEKFEIIGTEHFDLDVLLRTKLDMDQVQAFRMRLTEHEEIYENLLPSSK